MDDKLKEALRKVSQILEANGLRYAVVGGIALSHWNVSRFTHDIDIKLLVPNADYTTVRSVLRKAFPQRDRLQLPETALIVAVTVEDVIVDFLMTLPGYEELIVERAVEQDLGEFSIWVCSAEDLIIQKVVAGREKDWPDVEGLLIEQWGKLDQAYIDNWLDQFASALENPELLSRYSALCRKVERLVA